MSVFTRGLLIYTTVLIKFKTNFTTLNIKIIKFKLLRFQTLQVINLRNCSIWFVDLFEIIQGISPSFQSLCHDQLQVNIMILENELNPAGSLSEVTFFIKSLYLFYFIFYLPCSWFVLVVGFLNVGAHNCFITFTAGYSMYCSWSRQPTKHL